MAFDARLGYDTDINPWTGLPWDQAPPPVGQNTVPQGPQTTINGNPQSGANIPPPPDLSNKWMWNGSAWVENTTPAYSGEGGTVNPGWSIDPNGNAVYNTPKATPPPNTGGGGGGGSTGPTIPKGDIGSLLKPFDVPTPTYVQPDAGNTWAQIGPAPTFPTLPTWRAPSGDEAASLPGYKFALDQGRQALEGSAAARGVTNTGGTLADIIKFGDQFGAQNYQTARSNSLEDYGTNLASQYLLPYNAAFNAWQTRANLAPTVGNTALNASNSQNNFNRGTWQDLYTAYRNRGLDTNNFLLGFAQLGAGLS